ncbi:MAG TPA: PEP-CTERM sorting domain-containing protein [Candidatus Binatia bacterium]|jgi:hypothetical protein|nr:PEP-CTERM sorting domain-containing protein [Candidatus Binatia bacterium]
MDLKLLGLVALIIALFAITVNEIPQLAEAPEPSRLILLGVGLIAASSFLRRVFG